jgi:hypothetical protein
MIEIEFNLRLVERMGKGRMKMDIGESVSLSQLKAKLELTDVDVGILLINGAWASLNSIIKDGDFVQLYPYMEGG